MARIAKIDNGVKKRFEREEKKRSVATRDKRVYFLIVCEGERTEPNYFIELGKTLPVGMVDIKIEGSGKNTISLVEEAIKIRDKNAKRFDRVWVVFDKDSFPDVNFNGAIAKGKANQIECAWSNEAFELWLILHFMYRNTSMSRTEYKGVLESEIRKRSGDKGYKYLKNALDTFALVTQYGSQEDAIRNAAKLVGLYGDESFATHNPCTLVHKLVEELSNPQEILKRL